MAYSYHTGDWVPRDTSSGNFEDYMYNSLNEYAAATGQDVTQSNRKLWKQASDDSRENIMNLAFAKYQLDMQRAENDRAWERETSYNSPEAQMQRYMNAGLNPNVIYGQIGNGNGNYEAPKVPQVTFKSNRYQKLDKAMEVMSTIANIVGQGAQLAGQIEGVKNQSLQNQILEESLPYRIYEAQFPGKLASSKEQFYNSLLEPDGNGGYTWKPGGIEKAWDILWPEVSKGAAVRQQTSLYGSKQTYQDWYNKDIAPLYQKQMEGKSLSAEEKAAMDAYNRQQLETFPPALRPFVWLFMNMWQTVK